MSAPWPGHSALVVPVPELEPLVRARHGHYDPAYVSADPTFAHAHITVLAPFVDPDTVPQVASLIEQIASETMPFEFELTRVATFPNGIIHLVPQPATGFRELTTAVCRAVPGYPPYAGAYGSGVDSVAPHLTVDACGPGLDEDLVRSWVAPQLPVPARADRLQLSWYESGACRTLAVWPLGPGR